MKSALCPTCGCSLVRLKISREQATHLALDGADYHFCCKGCADIFRSDPQRYLAQISDIVVCPGCLGEKPLAVTTRVAHAGRTVNFCGCPHCEEAFARDPDRLVARLADW
jgi:YHS domain-containing protein